MFLDTRQYAKASITEDDTFVALELSVLDDFSSACATGAPPLLQQEHIDYLKALHRRGDDELGLELMALLLDDSKDYFVSDIGSASVSCLLILQAEMFIARESIPEAESTLIRAAELSSSPDMSSDIAIRLACLQVKMSRRSEALTVLQNAYESLEAENCPSELIRMLAAAHSDAGNYAFAEKILGSHIEELSINSRPLSDPDLAISRVFLASVMLAQGRCGETEQLLDPQLFLEKDIPPTLIELASYYSAACTAASSGRLLAEALGTSPFPSMIIGRDAQISTLFQTFAWMNPQESPQVKDAKSFFRNDDSYVIEMDYIFRQKEFNLQGTAYGYIAASDYLAAVDCFRALENLRAETGQHQTLIAALDTRALAFALSRAGHSEALATARMARRRLQLLMGLSFTGTLWAILEEARILIDLNARAQAQALVQHALAQASSRGGIKEVHLRLRLMLIETDTDSLSSRERLTSIELLASDAAGFSNIAPDLPLTVQYLAAINRAALGNYVDAERDFRDLLCSLEGIQDRYPDLFAKVVYGQAGVLQHSGQFADAVDILRPLQDAAFHLSRPFSLAVRQRIGASLVSMEDYSGAADAYGVFADELRERHGDKDPDQLNLRLAQADSLLAGGRYVPARRIYRKVWEVLHQNYVGLDAYFIRAVLGNAACLRRLKDYSGAVLNYRRVLSLVENAQNSSYMSQDSLLELRKWLAWCLEMTGASNEAALHYAEAVQLLEALHPDRVELIEELEFRRLCCSP